MSEKKMVDVEISLGKELADSINKMTKPELVNRLVTMLLRNRVQDETVGRLEREIEAMIDKNKVETTRLRTKLDKAESYVEQGRAMIVAAMGGWYEYDV